MLRGADLHLFEEAYRRLYANYPRPEVAVYLRLPPIECLRRVRARGRPFEAGLTLDRLQRMSDLYERHAAELAENVLTLDVSPGASRGDVARRIKAMLT